MQALCIYKHELIMLSNFNVWNTYNKGMMYGETSGVYGHSSFSNSSFSSSGLRRLVGDPPSLPETSIHIYKYCCITTK